MAYLDLFRQPAPLYKYNPDLYVGYPFRVPGYAVSENTGVYELPALKFWENSSANDEGSKTPQFYNQKELDNILQYCTETSVDKLTGIKGEKVEAVLDNGIFSLSYYQRHYPLAMNSRFAIKNLVPSADEDYFMFQKTKLLSGDISRAVCIYIGKDGFIIGADTSDYTRDNDSAEWQQTGVQREGLRFSPQGLLLFRETYAKYTRGMGGHKVEII